MTRAIDWATLSALDPKVLITSAGYEDRSSGLTKLAPAEFRPELVVVNLYTPSETVLLKRNLATLGDLRRFWTSRGSRVEVLESDPESPERFALGLSKVIGDETSPGAGVVLDITSFTRLFLYEILALFYKKNSLIVSYTEPIDFTDNLPVGNRDVFVVPSLRGVPDQDLSVRLVLLLGWEGERAQALVDQLDPDDVVPILGLDASDKKHIRWNDVARAKNKSLLERYGMEELRLPTLNPDGVRDGLLDKYRGWEDSNLIVCALGPKPQCIGVFEFARQRHRVQVLYSVPQSWSQPLKSGQPPLSRGVGGVYLWSVW
jgi:hypothetical protein